MVGHVLSQFESSMRSRCGLSEMHKRQTLARPLWGLEHLHLKWNASNLGVYMRISD
jgi:hypothetical protein